MSLLGKKFPAPIGMSIGGKSFANIPANSNSSADCSVLRCWYATFYSLGLLKRSDTDVYKSEMLTVRRSCHPVRRQRSTERDDEQLVSPLLLLNL